MILNAIIQKSKLKYFPNNRNQKQIRLLKSNTSDLNINSKNEKINKSVINTLSSKKLKKKSLLLKSKINFLIRQNSVKTTREMQNKFYLRNREALKNMGKSNELFSGIIKAPEKIVKKIILDYKNIQSYDKDVLSNNLINYKRNVEYLENQEIVKENQRLKEGRKFNKLKNTENPKLLITSYNRKNTDSYGSSLFSSPKFKPILKKPSLNYERGREKEIKLEEKVTDVLMQKKYLYYKRLKENAKKFCERIRNLDLDCKLYEKITNSNSKKNLQQQNYFNMGNLDRIVKLECIKDGSYSTEDYEGSSIFLKKCFNEYNLYCDKAISGYFPSFVKKEAFLNRTMIKYANLQGKFFGLPV